MGLQDMKLIFDNSQQTYYSGQTVTGRLRVHLDSPEKLHAIIVRFKGEASTSWTEIQTVTRDGKNEKVEVKFGDNDLYFENNVRVFGGTGGGDILPRGEHFFQYSMILPDHLPASFEGKYGNIRYTVKGILDNPWKYNHEVVSTITLLPNLNLNLDPNYAKPVHREESKTFCCCCCRSLPLTLTTHVPTKGYMIGENIPLTVDVENGSTVKISKVVCQLQQIVSYHSTSPQGIKKDITDAIRFKFDGPVPKSDSRSWTIDLKIPSVPASMLQSCSIIDVYYKIVVTAVPRGLYCELVVEFPIIIGTVPIAENTVQIQQHILPAVGLQQSMPMAMIMPVFMQQPAMPIAMQMPITAFPTAPIPEAGGGYVPLPQMATASAPVVPSASPPTYEESTTGARTKF